MAGACALRPCSDACRRCQPRSRPAGAPRTIPNSSVGGASSAEVLHRVGAPLATGVASEPTSPVGERIVGRCSRARSARVTARRGQTARPASRTTARQRRARRLVTGVRTSRLAQPGVGTPQAGAPLGDAGQGFGSVDQFVSIGPASRQRAARTLPTATTGRSTTKTCVSPTASPSYRRPPVRS